MPERSVDVSVGTMDDVDNDDGLVGQLPTAYAVALRLRRSGASDEDIAVALGIAAVSVPALVEVGLAKLDELRNANR